jgi:hypothetical protein
MTVRWQGREQETAFFKTWEEIRKWTGLKYRMILTGEDGK